MAFNLDEFRNTLVNGGARNTLFEMALRWPTGIASGGVASALSRFMVKATSIPASTVGTISAGYFGRKVKMAGDRTFADLTVTVYNDENFAIRKAMEEWSDRIAGHRSVVSQYRGGSQSGGYTADMTLTQLGRQGNPLRRYKFVGAFPTEIGTIDLDWDTNDQIETYTCTFAYQWWEVEGQIPTRDNPTLTVDVTVG